jgi:hypothetical protein
MVNYERQNGRPEPVLVMDKSAFQGLTRDEHLERSLRFRENITPVLLREILADLAKSSPTSSPEAVVQSLAGKFLGSGGVINADYRKLCFGNLTDVGRFEIDGRPVLDEYTRFREPDGTPAILITPTSANEAILRWASSEFSDGERLTAKGIRATAGSFSLDALHGRLRQHGVLLPRPKNIPDLSPVANDLLSRATLQLPILDWLADQLRLPAQGRAAVMRRWDEAGRPFLQDFAPYAYHCARVLLLVLIGMRHKVLTSRKTNRIDAEYLFYMPFCNVFTSGDRLHVQLAPMVLKSGQEFVDARDFKAAMAQFVEKRRAARAQL